MPNWVTNVMTVVGRKADLDAFCKEMLDEEKTLGGNPSESGRRFTFNKLIPMPAILNGTIAGGYTDLGRRLLTRENPRETLQSLLRYGFLSEDEQSSLKTLAKDAPENLGQAILDRLETFRATNPSVDETLTSGALSLRAEQETGSIDWYEWATQHWGTKWDASSSLVEGPVLLVPPKGAPQDLSEADLAARRAFLEHWDDDELPVPDAEELENYAGLWAEEPLYALGLRFDTAWGDPAPVFDKIRERFPDLLIRGSCEEESGAYWLLFEMFKGNLEQIATGTGHRGYDEESDEEADEEACEDPSEE